MQQKELVPGLLAAGIKSFFLSCEKGCFITIKFHFNYQDNLIMSWGKIQCTANFKTFKSTCIYKQLLTINAQKIELFSRSTTVKVS